MQPGTIQQVLLVGFGGALGSMLRHAGNLLFTTRTFPVTTFFINILGSLVMGMVVAWSIRHPAAGNWKLFLATGLCGGFTTFSAFSYENLLLLQEGKTGLSILYITASAGIGLLAAWMGYSIMK